MQWKIKEYHRNVHEFDVNFNTIKESFRFCYMPDVHWDNPHCDRRLLKQHLDYFKEHNIPIIFGGDLFCVMQGKYDKRKSKNDIRPEHNVDCYFDAIIETAREYFLPYSELITIVGYGNHETSICRHHETDLIQRFVQSIKTTNKNSPIVIGGYGGWIKVAISLKNRSINTKKGKYFHGSGGGGPVTKGVIQSNRQSDSVSADFYLGGHIHEEWHMVRMRERLSIRNRITHDRNIHIRAPGYKEEYGDNFGGYHTETGRPPKPLGCAILDFSIKRDEEDTKYISINHRHIFD